MLINFKSQTRIEQRWCSNFHVRRVLWSAVAKIISCWCWSICTYLTSFHKLLPIPGVQVMGTCLAFIRMIWWRSGANGYGRRGRASCFHSRHSIEQAKATRCQTNQSVVRLSPERAPCRCSLQRTHVETSYNLTQYRYWVITYHVLWRDDIF